jgi:eukaryotic-like serine/threonine-protein kinase
MSGDEPNLGPPAPTDPSEPTGPSEPGPPSDSLWEKLRERRITQLVIAYVAGGWIALTGVDQLVDRQVLPELIYRISLVLFIGGLGIALILGWYHGEKGRQKVTLPEVILLGIVSLVTFGSSYMVASRFVDSERSGREVGLDLGPDARRVAVMYFQQLDDDGGLSFLADGLTEALIDELARIPELDVISKNGVSPFRGVSTPPDEVGRELNAGSVIDGSVESTRGGIRVNVQLLDGASGANINRTAITLPDDDLLAVRDSVVGMAAQFLRTWLGEEVRVRDQRAASATVEGWTLYQRAERMRKEATDVAGHERGEALRLIAAADSLLILAESVEPSWGDPSALRADLALRRGVWAGSMAERLEAIEAGVAHANRALERQPRHARALETRGNLRRFHHFLDVSPSPAERWRLLDQAEEDLRAAVAADPGLASAYALLTRLYYERRDLLSAALAAQNALQADYYLADADDVLEQAFLSHFDLGQFSQAQARCEEGAARFPESFFFVDCQLSMMLTTVVDADPTRAWALRDRADALTPASQRVLRSLIRKMMVGAVLARAELPDSARAVLMDARGGPEIDPEQELFGFEAIARTRLGDHDEAIRLLRRYVTANPDHARGFLAGVEGELHWFWRPLRNHPDFAEFLRLGG